jgi:putative FmdB family regulatory protein
MPTYEYVCESCGNEWEAEQSIKADPLKDCPKTFGTLTACQDLNARTIPCTPDMALRAVA